MKYAIDRAHLRRRFQHFTVSLKSLSFLAEDPIVLVLLLIIMCIFSKICARDLSETIQLI